MFLNCLPPVLEEMLAHEQENEMVHLEISNPDMLKAFFAEKVVQALLQKQRMLVVVPDRMDDSVPSKILTKYNLGHYSVTYNTSTQAHTRLSERMVMLAKLKEIPLLRQEFNHSVLKYKEIKHKIHETLLSITRSSVKNPSFKEMLLSIKPRPKAPIAASVIEAIAGININPDMIERIKSLQEAFKDRFMYIDESGGITKACLEDTTALTFALKDLTTLSTRVEEISINIEHELYLMKRVISYELEEELAQWLKIKEELQNAFLEYELDNLPSSFEEKGMTIINRLGGCKYLKFNLNIVPEIGWGQVPEILNIITAIMEGAGNSIDIYFEEYIRKLSPFNTQNELLDRYIEEGIDILKLISSSKYIEHQCSNKFLQVDALLEALHKARRKLILAVTTLKDKEYIDFLQMQLQLNFNDKVMHNLSYLSNEDWSQIIEFYGNRSHLTNNYHANMSRLDDWYNELVQAHQLLRHNAHKEIHNRWCHQRSQAMTAMKNSHWDIYQRIFESDEDADLSLKKVVEDIGELLQDFFPVIVVKETDFKNLMKLKILKFDVACYFDPKDISIADLKMLQAEKIQPSIVSTHSLDTAELSQNFDVLSNFSGDSLTNQPVKLQQLEKTDRYKYAVSIACTLNTLVRPVNIYKVGEQVIISTVDQMLDRRISKALKVSSKNILFSATTDMAHLVEVFIHYDQLHLITENNMLNDQKGLSALWQRSVIDFMEKSGVVIHNVFTCELYQNIPQTIAQLIGDIQVIIKDESDHKVALSI